MNAIVAKTWHVCVPSARRPRGVAGNATRSRCLPNCCQWKPFRWPRFRRLSRPWVRDVAERMHCPPDFVAVPLLVAAASLVARRVGIRPQRRTDWIERGNLWALIVGRPGIMKSPAMAQALAPMDRLEGCAAQAFNAQAAQHQVEAMAVKLRAEANVKAARAKLKKDATANVGAMLTSDDEKEAPTRRRYVVNDADLREARRNPCREPGGVLSVRDEMRGLFLSLAREESAPARAFYLQAWSGGSYTFDRIGRGTVTVADARLSMIGGIQPGPLGELVQQARRGAADDGMIERFLIAWPDAPGEWREVDRWPDTEGKRSAWETFERLDALSADSLDADARPTCTARPEGCLSCASMTMRAKRSASGAPSSSARFARRRARAWRARFEVPPSRPGACAGAACDRWRRRPGGACPRLCERWRWANTSRATQGDCTAAAGA